MGREVDEADVALLEADGARGFSRYQVEGLDDPQSVRPVAVPTVDRGVRRAWETIVLEAQPEGTQPVGFVHFIDAETGEVLLRLNRLLHFAGPDAAPLAQAAVPEAMPFSGATGENGACAEPDFGQEVGEGTGNITIAAQAVPNVGGAAVLDGDILLNLYFEEQGRRAGRVGRWP